MATQAERATIALERIAAALDRLVTPPTPGALSDPGATEIEELELDKRAYNCLKSYGLNTVEEVVAYHRANLPAGLFAIPNFGPASLASVEESLLRRGISLYG